MTGATPALECEIKLAIERPAYETLHRRLPGRVAEVEQHNLFLDTADRRLSGQRWALRIRRETAPGRASRVLVTVKGPATRMAGAVRRTEIEARADEELWQRAHAGSLPSEAFQGLPGDFLRQQLGLRDPVEPVLEFTNRRTTFALELAGTSRHLQLDRTTFSTGEIDYEIELELEHNLEHGHGRPPAPSATELNALREIKAVTTALEALLARLDVGARPAHHGKYTRALGYAGLQD